MGWNSVRVRLTLWNVGVMALVLAAFGGALRYSLRANLRASADRELSLRAQRLRERFEFGPRRDGRTRGDRRTVDPGFVGPPAPSGTRGFGRPLDFAAGTAFAARPGARPGPRRDGWETRSASGPDGVRTRPSGPPFATETERFDFFRRARFTDLKGQALPWDPEPAWDPGTIALAARGQERFSTIDFHGEDVRVLSTPTHFQGKIVGVTQVARPLAELQRIDHEQSQTLLMLIPLAILVAAAGGMFLTERALRPVRQVTLAAAQITHEELGRRLEVRGKDEFAKLASTFNDMVARLEEAFRAQETAHARLERAYTQQRRFTGDASHELRTPLTRIKAVTSLTLAEESTLSECREALAVADRSADVMTRIVQDLLFLARSDADQLVLARETASVAELVAEAVQRTPAREGHPIEWAVTPDDLTVTGDPEHLTRLIVNLLENACRHTPPEGHVEVSAHLEGSLVILRVRDTGEGIPREHLPNVCERFYRVDAARSRKAGGTGLGLAICQSIVQSHGGTLTLESEVGAGTTVTIRLTAAAQSALRGAGEAPRSGASPAPVGAGVS